MDLETFQQLLTPHGQSALTAATSLSPTESRFLACFDRLSKRFPASLSKAALETVILRDRARSKFSTAEKLYFTREALEQSSSEPVAFHRTRRFQYFSCVADLCCGIGGDAMALATAGLRIVAVDRDPLRARMTEANLNAIGKASESTVICDDVCSNRPLECEAFFCDPARRAGEMRFRSLNDYEPTLDAVLERYPPAFPAGFKLAPAVPWSDLERYPGEVEFLSWNGELKECVLWLGPLAAVRRRATVLPSAATLSADDPAPTPKIQLRGNVLYDPDPSVTRAGLVTNLAHDLSASMLDAELAFLIGESAQATPFATLYEIDAWMPFHVKNIQGALRERNVGYVTIVKRGSAIQPEELRSKLKLKGSDSRFLLLTRHEQKPIAIIARRVESLK